MFLYRLARTRGVADGGKARPLDGAIVTFVSAVEVVEAPLTAWSALNARPAMPKGPSSSKPV